MDITIIPRLLRGDIRVIPSKSIAHRYLICAALADNPTQIRCEDSNRDIEATADCLRSLGADIIRTETGYTVFPISKVPDTAVLNCCESGSTLRFMLPIVGALGVDATFIMAGRLPQRPLSPLWEEMVRMGCSLTRPTENTLRCTGKLQPGTYTIGGGVSSQYITGLLFSLSLIDGETELFVSGKIESQPYIAMTEEAMAIFRSPHYHSPGTITVEGDWSNGAFWITAQFLNNPLSVQGLNAISSQGDRAIVTHLSSMGSAAPTIDVSDIPDLVPIMAVAAAAQNGAGFTNIQRLRLKESDRVATVIDMISNLGGHAEATEDTLRIYGTGLRGGTVDSHNDHRIAMAAAIAATVCQEPVTIIGAEAVNKSYPKFWEEYRRLGGNYEQHIR